MAQCFVFYVTVRSQALKTSWAKHHRFYPKSRMCDPDSLKMVELILPPEDGDSKDDELEETQRGIGENDIGMVAWKMTAATPEFPEVTNQETSLCFVLVVLSFLVSEIDVPFSIPTK